MAKIIAVAGKGGVGKTSISAAIVKLLVQKYPDKKILAIDADPAVGLSTALGIDVKMTIDDIRKEIVETVEDGQTKAAIELLGDAKQDAEWLVRMVENLLSITRISGSEQANIEKSPELIEEILGECIANFKKRNSDVNLKVTIPDEPLMVNVDAMLIEQVIMNLLDNAAKHAEGMTELRLDVKCSGSWALVSVADDGAGLDPAIIPVLFRGQIDPADGKSYDSNRFRGIGLAACQAIVTAHGGTISAANRPEGGAVFSFTIPLEEEKEE